MANFPNTPSAPPGNPAPCMPGQPWPVNPVFVVWNAEREALLIAARRSVAEFEAVKKQATDQVAAALAPCLGDGFNVALLVANAKRVRAALAPFDHDD